MWNKFNFLVLLLAILFVTSSKAQVNVSLGEHFMGNEPIRKLHVCVEDQSVWLLSAAGKVYFKTVTDADFSIYPATANLTITGLTGFNADEMYFISGIQVLKINNGTETLLPVPFPGVTRINEIAVVHGKDDENIIQQAVSYKDYLAVATNKYLYFSIRGSNTITAQYIPRNPYYFNEPDFQIGYAGFKHQNYRYLHPSNFCGVEGYHENDDLVNGVYHWSAIPEKPPYPSKVNASILAGHLFDPFRRSDFTFWNNIWATDDGVYNRQPNSCIDQVTRKHLSGEQVNTLENVYALTPIRKQDFILAGSNTGIFFTRRSVFPENFESPSLDYLQFERLSSFPNLKVNVLKTETNVEGMLSYGQKKYYSLCEKVIWAATEKGVYKLYLTLDQEHYKNMTWSDMRFNKLPSNNDFSNPLFRLCGNETVLATTLIPESFKSQILFQWFRDGVELPDLLGKMETPLSEAGVYTIKITSLCDQITITSNPITIIKNNVPQISFNYPAEMTICEGQSVTLTTQQDPTYSYRWYKNGIQLPGEANNSYIAFTPGSYHVEVSNCAGQFTASATTKLNVDIVPKPVLQHNKISYCKDDIAVLSVNNPMGFKIRWDYNFTELTQFRNQPSITAPGDGKYMVTFINENECIKQSDAYDLVRHSLPLAVITRSNNKTLCYGETVNLTVNATAGASYLWSNGASSREIMVSDPGTYSVQVTSTTGCTSVSNPVDVFINDQLVLAKPPESKICTFTGEQLTLVADPGYANYSWNGVNTVANTMSVSAPGNYTLEVTDAMGCKANTLFTVIAWCKEVVVANAFSPNNDGNNDIWRVGGLASDPQASLQIYNRFGSLVLQTTGSNAQWDGKIKGKDAPVGVYYYIIKSSQSSVPLKGSITLVR